jgi:formylglycine-generating enzyme required for sulfatase activity
MKQALYSFVALLLFPTLLFSQETKRIDVNGVKIDMVKVEGGTFYMGIDSIAGTRLAEYVKPVHRVTMSSYYIGKYEVTQKLWETVMKSNESYTKGSNLPVERVSWYDCEQFIATLNSITGLHFSFPTEAQWEYAAKGGNKSKGYTYSGSNDIDAVAWYLDNSDNTISFTVGSKMPNELGIYDMSGNVWEWCFDWFSNYEDIPTINPSGPTSGIRKVIRGGSSRYRSINCRTGNRYFYSPKCAFNFIGLRLVLNP